MSGRDPLDDYLDALTVAAKLKARNGQATEPPDVEPDRLSAELLDALNQANSTSQSQTKP